MSRTAIRRAHEAWSNELAPLGLRAGEEMPEDAPPRHRVKVTCSNCGHKTEIAVPDDPEVEVRWSCNAMDDNGVLTCGASNMIEGHAGEPGEGSLNPNASAVDDDELLEAAVRRGLIDPDSITPEMQARIDAVQARVRPTGTTHRLSVGGGMAPAGSASPSTSSEENS